MKPAKKHDEHYETLLILSAFIGSIPHLTIEQVRDRTGIVNDDLPRWIQRLVQQKALAELQFNGETVYELTAEGYRRTLPLKKLKVNPEDWARAERRFSPPGRPKGSR